MTEHPASNQFHASSFMQGHNAQHLEKLYAQFASARSWANAKTLAWLIAVCTSLNAQPAFANPDDVSVCANDLTSEDRKASLKAKGWVEAKAPQKTLASQFFLGNAGTNASRNKAKDTWAWALNLAENGEGADVWLTKDKNYVQIGENKAATRFCVFVAKKLAIPKVVIGLPKVEGTPGHAIWRHAGKVQDTFVTVHYATARFEPVFGMTIPYRLTATFLTQ